MRFRKHSASELEAGNTIRCGRCAEVLPDETQTYCRACGVAFSRVPPTDSAMPLENGRIVRRARSQRRRATVISMLCVLVVACSYAMNVAFQAYRSLAETSAVRKVVFYTYNIEGFPQASTKVTRGAIAVAVQAFEDHFGVTLKNYEVREGRLPAGLETAFRGPWKPEAVGPGTPMLMSTWEKTIYPSLTGTWRNRPDVELPVLITNIPIFADDREHSGIETRHLAQVGLVSGLGHPSLVAVSTYRMLTENPRFKGASFNLNDDTERTRHLGEYVIAHELGHALLGLSDVVVEADSSGLRAPASIADKPAADCLMHTDRGGGFKAWAALRARPLGNKASCHAYDDVLKAFHAREEGFALFAKREFRTASLRHREAVAASRAALPWVHETWRDEQRLFDALSW